MMVPERFKETIENEFGKNRFNIKTKTYTFDRSSFCIDDGTKIPSGMCFEDPNIKMRYSCCGVSEFYGPPLSLKEDIRGVDILIIHGAALPAEVLEQADKLKYVISLRGGPANIDTAYMQDHGIELLNTSGKNAPAVAEFALGALLDFERGISRGSKMLESGQWWIKGADTYESHEIRGKKFGFIGYGHIARSFRELLSGFNIEAFAYSPHIEDSIFEQDHVQRVSLLELVSTCDYVSLHSRAAKGAPPIIDSEMLRLMQKHAVLINTARGALLDYPALKQALEEKWIRGAVLDVLGNEPFGFYRELIKLDNVLVTPHIAGQSAETCERACNMCVGLLQQIAAEF